MVQRDYDWMALCGYLTCDQAAQRLGVDVPNVIRYCEAGLLDSWLHKDGSRHIFEGDVERFTWKGPNKIMAFTHAIKFLRNPRLFRYARRWYAPRRVRRPNWRHMDFLQYCEQTEIWQKEGKPLVVGPDALLLGVEDCTYCPSGWSSSLYIPTEEDKAATDWFIHIHD